MYTVTLENLVSELEKLFGEPTSRTETTKNPLEIVLPGAIKDSIRVKLVGTELKISAKLKNGEDVGRTFYVGTKIDPAQITAKYEDGILYVNLKTKEVQEKEIVVQ